MHIFSLFLVVAHFSIVHKLRLEYQRTWMHIKVTYLVDGCILVTELSYEFFILTSDRLILSEIYVHSQDIVLPSKRWGFRIVY